MFKKQAEGLQRGDLFAICSILCVALAAIAYIGMITLKRAGGMLPWELFLLEDGEK